MTGWLIMYQNQLKRRQQRLFKDKKQHTGVCDGTKKTLKGDVEGEFEKENQEEEGDINLTPHEHERALKGAYRSLVIPSAPKADVDSYFDQTKPHIKTLIKNQLKEMGSAKITMTLWVMKPIMLLIALDPEDAENAQDVDGGTGDNYIRHVTV